VNLREVIATLGSSDDALCIVAKRPWSRSSEARLVRLTSDYRIPPEVLKQGYEYFLEVHIAGEEAIGDLWTRLSPEQREDAVIFYAENDASPTWLTELRAQY
jgi:hypothetical protein